MRQFFSFLSLGLIGCPADDTGSEGAIGSETGVESEVDTSVETDASTQTDTNASTDTSASTETDTSAETDASAVTDTCAEPVSITGTGSDMDTCSTDTGSETAPEIPTLELSFSQIKQFDFSWAPTPGADYHRIFERAKPGEDYVQIGADIVGESVSLTMPLHFRTNASYELLACNDFGCSASEPVDVVGSLAEAVGYVKASNTDGGDHFGYSVTLSADGTTLAVGAFHEDSNATGIGGDQADDSAPDSGAVYVFELDAMNGWTQRAYIKASNTGAGDNFGHTVVLSDDGDTLAVSAPQEDSNVGLGGNQADNSAPGAGAVYVYVRTGMNVWTQQAFIKASNPGAGDNFGGHIALSADGDTLAAVTPWEASNAVGIGGNQADNSAHGSGAAYVYVRDEMGAWTQQAYVKASNASANDLFGWGLALSDDGDTMAVGAIYEASNDLGIGGDQSDNSATHAGAAYVFERDANVWTQAAYVKAFNTDAEDRFGYQVALSGDGDTLAVSALHEASNAVGVGGDQSDDSIWQAGAVYIYERNGMNVWAPGEYVKSSNTGWGDQFGSSVELSGDGNTLVVHSFQEDSDAIGIGGNQADDSAESAGALYVFERGGIDGWTQAAYVKASNTGAGDQLGRQKAALSSDGTTLVVGADEEDSNAIGIGGNQADDSAGAAGAVYLF